VADKLLKDNELTIPCVIDGMDNLVNEAYRAHPDRIFLVRTDGRLAVAGERGPFGFEPALIESRRWLEALRDQGVEPDLPEKAAEPGEERHVTPLPEDLPDGADSAKTVWMRASLDPRPVGNPAGTMVRLKAAVGPDFQSHA
jgi:Iodothyronine deiodinase